MVQHIARYRLFHRGKNFANRILDRGWPNQQMNMLRHDHVRPKMEGVARACQVYGINEPVSRQFTQQEWLPPKA
jgi:hypothetical protein